MSKERTQVIMFICFHSWIVINCNKLMYFTIVWFDMQKEFGMLIELVVRTSVHYTIYKLCKICFV